ncbi:uncharacterized protein LOC143465491 isoform X1 [Clavelina lepadiformis]|uniref:uncharacterized protein LOC143465491 isoform X1 n=1 Tax=Clavelina lepadiformis TaxID=159417 RepID=UPI004042AC17
MKTCVIVFAFLCFVLSVNAVPAPQLNKDSETELATTAANVEKPTTIPRPKKFILDCTPYCRYNVFNKSRDGCPTEKLGRFLCRVCRYVLNCRTTSSKIGP